MKAGALSKVDDLVVCFEVSVENRLFESRECSQRAPVNPEKEGCEFTFYIRVFLFLNLYRKPFKLDQTVSIVLVIVIYCTL